MWPFHCLVESFSISANSTVLKETPGKEITLSLHVSFTWNWLRLENYYFSSPHFYALPMTISPKDWSWHEWRLHTSEKSRGQSQEENQIDHLFFISHHIKVLIYSFQLKLVLHQSPDAVQGSFVNMNSRKTYEMDAILAATIILKIQNAASVSTAAILSHVSKFPINADPILKSSKCFIFIYFGISETGADSQESASP